MLAKFELCVFLEIENSSASKTEWIFKTLYDNIDPSYHTQKFSRVLKQLFFTRPADRAGRESTTLIITDFRVLLKSDTE